MSTLRLLLAEIGYRKLNFAMSVLAVVVAVALFVAGPALLESYARQAQQELETLQARVEESAAQVTRAEAEAAAQLAAMADETRKIMRDLGFNLILVHRDTDIVQFLSSGMPGVDMPQEWVERLAQDVRLTLITHLVATLRGKVAWEGREVRLVGYLPETPQKHMRHETPMGYVVEPGSVLLGYQLSQGKKVDDTIEVAGKPLRVAACLPEQGTDEDTTLTVHLSDAQELLGKPGKINQILALECRCSENALPELRRQLGRVLPDAQVLRDNSKAVARARQRAMVAEKNRQIVAKQKELLAERQRALDETAQRRNNIQGLLEGLAAVLTPLVVLASGIWVGLLALANVRQRRTEIGLLRALGKGSGTIWSLFLGKAALVGLLGAALGCALGAWLGLWLGAGALQVSPEYFGVRWDVLACALAGAPAVSAVASYLPALVALSQDPSVVLRDQ